MIEPSCLPKCDPFADVLDCKNCDSRLYESRSKSQSPHTDASKRSRSRALARCTSSNRMTRSRFGIAGCTSSDNTFIHTQNRD